MRVVRALERSVSALNKSSLVSYLPVIRSTSRMDEWWMLRVLKIRSPI